MSDSDAEYDAMNEDTARRWTEKLIGTGISVLGGGRNGPYTVSVCRLGLEDADAIIRAIQEITGREPVQEEPPSS